MTRRCDTCTHYYAEGAGWITNQCDVNGGHPEPDDCCAAYERQ